MSQPPTKQEADAAANGRASRRRAARESALNKGPGEEVKRELYHCNYCQKDISNTPRIKCAVCTDFDLCLECFSVGVEIIPHRNTHDYRVVDNLSTPIYDPDWGADEEVLLLEAIDNYGLGNWQAVADQVGPTKSALQCKFEAHKESLRRHEEAQAQAEAELQRLLKQRQEEEERKAQLQAQQEQQQRAQQEAEQKEQEAAAAAAAAAAAQKPEPVNSAGGAAAGSGPSTRKGRKGAAAAAVSAASAGEVQGTGTDLGPDGPTSTGGATSEGLPTTSTGPAAAAKGGRTTRQRLKQAAAQSDKAEGGQEAEPAQDGAGKEEAGASDAMVIDAPATTAGTAEVKQEGVVAADAPDVSAPRDQTVQAAGEGAEKVEQAADGGGPDGDVHLTGDEQATARSQKRLHRSHTAEDAAVPHPAAAHVKAGTLTLHHEHPTTADKAPPKEEPGQQQEAAAAAAPGAAPALPLVPVPGAAVAGQKVGAAGQKLAGLPPVGPPPGPAHKEPKVQGDYAMGYHAKRNEFDPEYDNDAECIIADMEFTEADTEEDRQLKLRILQIYNTRLDAREARRAFLREYGLLSMRKVQALERRRGAAERDTHARLRVFARYSTPAAHDELVEGLLLEQRLRARIQELKGYRRLGIRTLEEADLYESEQRKTKKAAGTPPVALDATPAAVPSASQLVWDLATGVTPGLTPPSASQAAVVAAAAKDSGAATSATAPPLGGNKGAASSLHQWRTHRGVQLDITCLPGTQVLTAREREACAALRLMPCHYLALKDMMLRDSEKHGAIARNEARTYFRLDAQRCLKLYDLWVACGWVTRDKATSVKDNLMVVAAAAAGGGAGVDVAMVDVKPDQEGAAGGTGAEEQPVAMDLT